MSIGRDGIAGLVLLAISLVRAPADTRSRRRVDSFAVTREPARVTLTLIDTPRRSRPMRTERGAEAMRPALPPGPPAPPSCTKRAT